MKYQYIRADNGSLMCEICNSNNIYSYFASEQSYRRHVRIRHSLKPIKKQDIDITELKHQIKTLNKKIDKIQTSTTATSTSTSTSTSNATPVSNNVTLYYNKDLKYYPELVKIMGREKACNYLLYGMPETKDIFGVIDKLFLQNGALGCPFRYDHDTGDFLIARAEGVFDRDPTGETIDRENKSKLQDAILSAYVDTTKQISRECADLRIARLNGEYTEADQEKLTRRFDALMTVEPIRPYEVIDLMNGLKPKKRDYDKIKKMCPAIVKKITIS